MSLKHYIMAPDGSYRKAESLDEYCKWDKLYPDGKHVRWVAKTRRCGYEISTVFLGIDHQFSTGQPLLFETMIFSREENDSLAEECMRCTFFNQAIVQHDMAVERVREHVGEWKWFWGRFGASEWYRTPARGD